MAVPFRHLPLEQQLATSVGLFIRLRWIPPAVILVGGLVARYALDVRVSVLALALVAAAIAGYNVLLRRWFDSLAQPTVRELLRCANVQLILDVLAITLLVHLTGGVLSPLVWFYSIHIIMGAIFFSWPAIVAATAALWAGLTALLIAEHVGLLAHHAVFAPEVEAHYGRVGFLVAVIAGTAALWATQTWLVSLIVGRVRVAEREDRELQEKYKHALDELTASEKKRELYRRSLTHELRAPIAAAQALLRVLERGELGPLAERQTDGVRRASVRLDQLQEMIRDLLTIERATRTDARRESVGLAGLLADIIEIYRPQIDERRLRLEFDVPVDLAVFVEPDDARTIFSNLVSNAVKYNRDGAALRIVAQPHSGAARVIVADEGIGIPERDRTRLFGEFFRATNAKELAVHGTGLGLAIVKQLAEQNGGAVELESVENLGTTVTVTLPVRPV